MVSVVSEVLHMGVLPQLEVESEQDIVEVVQALEKAGVPCIKLSSKSMPLVEKINLQVPSVIIGIDAVTDVEQAQMFLSSGAKFLIADNLPEEVKEWAKDAEIPVLFEKDLPGGIFTVAQNLVESKQWSAISKLLKQAVFTMLDFNLKHVGINSKNEEESNKTASAFESIFGLAKEDRGGAYFAGDVIEIMKKPFYGTHGHIAISTPFAGCAAYHLEQMGIKLNWQSAGYTPEGNLRVVYLQEEIGGFAVHILQR